MSYYDDEASAVQWSVCPFCLSVCPFVLLSGDVAPSKKLVHFSLNFSTVNSPKCVSIQIVLKVKLKVKGHEIWAL